VHEADAPNALLPAVNALCGKLLANSSSAMSAMKAPLAEIPGGQHHETEPSRASFDAGFTGAYFTGAAVAFLEKRSAKC